MPWMSQSWMHPKIVHKAGTRRQSIGVFQPSVQTIYPLGKQVALRSSLVSQAYQAHEEFRRTQERSQY